MTIKASYDENAYIMWYFKDGGNKYMKKKGLKIVTIGGGSSYTPELIDGFIIRNHELPVKEIWLVDVQAGKEKQDIVAEMARRMVKKAGVDIAIHTTLDRREALKDADFVTTQFRIGQMQARINDERIPISEGCIGQETNGAGGMFKGLRSIPVILDIVKDIQELCPNAWLINFANPSGMMTEAIYRKTTFRKAVGLCNIPINFQHDIAKLFEVEPKDIYLEYVGLNHMDFIKKVYCQGKDVTEEAIEKFLGMGNLVQNIDDIPWVPEFLRTLKLIPNDYLRYYFKRREMLEHEQKQYDEHGVRGEVVRRIEEGLFELYKDPTLEEKPDALSKRGGSRYSEAACQLIDSIYNDTKDIQTVNVPNNGAVIGLEPDEVAEVNCIITNHGPIPITAGKIPVAARGIIQTLKSIERLVIDAAVEGDYGKMLVAMTINPLIADDVLAKKLLDEMLDKNKAYLPNFNK